jgi:tetratricopeptide (TPR) repeat protein
MSRALFLAGSALVRSIRSRKTLMRCWLLLLLILSAITSPAQQGSLRTLDSMIVALPGIEAPDTIRIRALTRLAITYRMFAPDSGLIHAREALALSEKINWQEGLFESLRTLGVIHGIKGERHLSLEFYEKALAIPGSYSEKQRGGLLVNTMLVHFHQDDHLKAIEVGLRALKACEALDNPHCLSASYSNLGLIYNAIGEYEKSIMYHGKALELSRTIGNRDGEGRAIGNMGLVYQNMKRYHEALERYKEAIGIYEEIGQNRGRAINMANAGGIHTDVGDLVNAYRYTSGAIALSPELGDPNLWGIALANLGDLYMKAARIPDTSSTDPPFDIPVAQRLRMANEKLKEGIAMLEPTGHLEAIKNAWFSLAEVSELQNDHAQALEHMRKGMALKDSILSQDKLVQISKLETQRERELREKDGEIQTLRLQEARVEKQYFAGALMIALLFSGGLLHHHRTRRRKDRQLIQLKEELLQREKDLFTKQRLELEVKALRAQMNPHFIFNCLNSIQAMILDEKKQVATEYLQKFSRLIRLILDNARKESTTLEDEAEILTLYLDLEKLRMSNGFEYEISIPDDVEAAFTDFPSMVIQPLVENSIWHGLMPAQRQGHLRISFSRDHDHLTCVVEDNGIGRDRSLRMKNGEGHDSKGLQLIQERLQAWSQTRDTECRVFVQNVNEDGTGTRTEISIQYPAVVREREVAAVA